MKNQTIFFNSNVGIANTSTIAGPKEAEGPLAKYFDNTIKDDILGQKSHEKSEKKSNICAIKNLLNRTNLIPKDIDCCLAGDLLDEIISSNFTIREFPASFMGLYNACATFGEALILGASMIYSGLMDRIICSTTSHFSTAERQFRNPLELGSQRTPLAQWTVTGAGCTMLENNSSLPIKITCATIGKVVDFGVKDTNDMGAAMIPAAMDILLNHVNDTNRDVDYYDLILTGDLGDAGSRLLKKLIKEESGLDLSKNYNDCGVLIFNRAAQKVCQGGSGAACSNLVFNSYVFKEMLIGNLKKVLLVPTGALLSKISPLQKESIPGIAHAISVEVL